MQADYGLLNKMLPSNATEVEVKALINVDPRNNWRVHHLLEETYHKATSRGRKQITDATPWLFNEPESPQLRLPLWGKDLIK